MTIEDTIKNLIIDVERLKDKSNTSPEIFDAIKVPAQETVSVTASLSEVVSEDRVAVVGTSRVGFSEVGGYEE